MLKSPYGGDFRDFHPIIRTIRVKIPNTIIPIKYTFKNKNSKRAEIDPPKVIPVPPKRVAKSTTGIIIMNIHRARKINSPNSVQIKIITIGFFPIFFTL